MSSTTSEHHRKRLTCPTCGHSLHRVHRRPIERLTSLFVPQRRYRCHHCGWNGLRPADSSRPRLQLRRNQVVQLVLIVLVLLLIVAISVILTVYAETVWRYLGLS